MTETRGTRSQLRIPQLEIGELPIWIAVAAILVTGAIRYATQPTFWLDEAFIAVSLRSPSPQIIFSQLEYGQLFPRIYLGAIAIIREVFGYHIWALRLLPFLWFIAGTLLWARLLARKSRGHAVLHFLAGALLIGATFWLDQAIQLKHYTFDVVLALVPFVIGDDFFKETLVDGKKPEKLMAIALPCLLSYTYPVVMVARVAGWYVQHGRHRGWRLSKSAVLVLCVSSLIALGGIWFTDHRFNIKDSAAYIAYWSDCILGICLKQNADAAPRLIAKFLWGWHGRQPLVTAVLVPLQALGVYSVVKRLKRRQPDEFDNIGRSSRPIGSLVLLIGVVLASTIANYPICGGRVVLFTQVHTQLLALEGATFLLALQRKPKTVLTFLWLAGALVAFHSVRSYVRLTSTEPAENLRPVLSLIKAEQADVVLVHPCSVAQVRSLEDALPVNRVVFGNDPTSATPSEKAWVLWTHLGEGHCVKELERIRGRARGWQVVHEGPGRGLALAEF